jgi:predicted AAA+ superfamily ATPase
MVPGRTLIFLDEIQECANARTALKSFALDGRYDVIASGSLLGIKYKNKKTRDRRVPKSIPVGYERQVTMHSLDFEEFLWARGITEEAIGILKGYCERREPVPDAVNRKYSDLLKEYLIVGGMPAVVNAYVASGNFGPVQEEQE